MDDTAPTAAEPGLTFEAPEELFDDPHAEQRWRSRISGEHVRLPRSGRARPSRSVYSSNRSGTYELWVWDRDTDTHRQATRRDGGTALGELSADGEFLWWFADTAGNEFGHWVRQPFEGGEPALAMPAAGDGIASGLALGSTVAIVCLATRDGVGIWRQYTDQPAGRIYHHTEDAMLGFLTGDDAQVLIRHTEHGDASTPGMKVLDVGSGETVAELRDAGQMLTPMGFGPRQGDRRMLAVHERYGRDALLLWHTDTGAVEELDIDLPGQLSGRWISESTLLLLHAHAARTTMYRYELASGSVEPIGPRTGMVDAATPRDGGSAIEYSWSSASLAPRVCRWTTADGASLLFPDQDRLPAGSVPFEDAWVDGPGGSIHVLIARPASTENVPNKTMFWLHGGPFSQERDVFGPRHAAWIDAGWTIVSTNYRGSTGYGAEWRQSIIGRPGLTEIEDLAAVHQWAVAAGVANPDLCVLQGGSWGGYLTLLALGAQPERWKAGLAILPITDFALAYEDSPEPLRAMARALFGGTPTEVPERYAAASPLALAEHVVAPTLIIAGRNDPRCPMGQIDAYATRLEEIGRAPAMYRYEGGHGSQVAGTVEDIMRVSVSFAAAVAASDADDTTPTTGRRAD